MTEAIVTMRNNQALATAEAADRAVAEVQASMLVAQRFPRNQIQALDRIEQACSRVRLAEGAEYQYARGGTDITGPSVHLLRAIAQSWGNLNFGLRELEQGIIDGKVGVYVEAFAHDLETNVRASRRFFVPFWRDTRSGGYAVGDARDRYELMANMAARRERACLQEVIPVDVVESAVDWCRKTLSAKADTSPEAVKKMVSAFEEFGVAKQQLEKRIQRRIDAITPAQVIGLRRIYSSLKDGMAQPGDFFAEPEKDVTIAPGPENRGHGKGNLSDLAAAKESAPESPVEIPADPPKQRKVKQPPQQERSEAYRRLYSEAARNAPTQTETSVREVMCMALEAATPEKSRDIDAADEDQLSMALDWLEVAFKKE